MYRFLIGSLLQNKQHDNKKRRNFFNFIFSTKKNNVPLYLSHEKKTYIFVINPLIFVLYYYLSYFLRIVLSREVCSVTYVILL